ncbi:hypothetical protein SRHO_G00309080 [Serrasalmus rhombeus]
MKQAVSKASEYMRTQAITAVKRVLAHAKRKKREAQSEVRSGKTPSKSVGGVFFLRMTVDEREHPFDVENNNGTQFPRVTSKRVSRHPRQNLFYLLFPQQVIRRLERTQYQKTVLKRTISCCNQDPFCLLVP